ncbi:hypothetical protein GPJ56_001961 [Histomonas meleagridis]|uniref:uncharacterized protein n=1 Tax=Histomonas meleagridis TaxID=135588 RepID=UPI0035597572|nr:hypothetical protein GPJ56_001961 [Histomonas meleagridis]KAH0800963.1 hypothetical protein GO595_006279 [Histomonas meleagridis]
MGVTEDCFGSLMFNSNTILQYPNQSINNNKVITSRQGQTKISYSNFTYNRKVSDDIYLIDVNADHSRGKSFELTYSNFMHNYGELMIEVSDHSRAWLMYCNFVNNTGPENSNLFYFQYVDSKAVDLQFLYFDKNIYPIFRNTLFTSQSLLKGCNFDIEEDEMYSPNSNKMQCINCTFGLETVPTCTLTIEAMASCVVPGTPLPPTPEETTEELMSSSQEATEETSIQTSSEEAISSSQKTVEETSFIITEITEETIISSQATAEETSPIITEITTETTEETIISSQATAEETSFIITEITTETTEETYTRTSEYVSDVSYASSSSQHSSGLNTFIIIIVVLIIMVIVIIIIVCFVKRDKQKDKNPNSFIENDLLKSDPSLFSAENSSELLSANSLDNPYALYETTPSRDGLDVDL